MKRNSQNCIRKNQKPENCKKWNKIKKIIQKNDTKDPKSPKNGEKLNKKKSETGKWWRIHKIL